MRGREAGAPMVVGSYNVHRCIGRDGVADAARTLRVIEALEPDILGLQEVEIVPERVPALPSLLREAIVRGFFAVPGPTLARGNAHYGNALLTRFPVVRTTHHDVSVPGLEPRSIIQSELDAPAGLPVRVLVTHFGLRRGERRRQARVLLHLLEGASRATMTILLGDLNEWLPGSRSLHPVDCWFGPQRLVRTFPSRRPLLALDRIYVRPSSCLLEIAAVRHGEAGVASDHVPVIATLAPPPRPGTL